MRHLLMDLMENFAQYGYVVIFLGLFIEGEVFLLATSLLAYMAGYSLWSVILVAIVASCLSDTLWFMAGRLVGEARMKKYGKYVLIPPIRYEGMKKFFCEHGKKTLFFAKFVYGIGRITIFVSAVAGVRLRMFAMMDFLATVVWSIALCSFAYLSAYYYGLSANRLIHSFRIIFGIVLALFVLQFVARWVYFSVTKKQQCNNLEK
jgi:membrane protein DedA with SNARE-associated domain